MENKTCNCACPCWFPMGSLLVQPPRLWWTPELTVQFFSSAQSFFLHSHVCLQWKALTKSGRLHWSHSSIKFVAKPFPGFWKMLESLRQQEAHSIREKAGHWSMLLLMGCISNIIGIKVFWKVWHLKRRVKYLCRSCFVGKDLRRQVGFPCFF